ncbi:AI-2E family transporter [Halobacillus sp. A1]|uniref:AI-2E family transporter n=1 Tax=Halobacillus sp. A1 TaxID=2880262 RepID=UPI0020A6B181|nr:AI-2E family transporter [Halobacillus sp. A1]MCP3030827.1 AI-2E family transporter [Halobacillus sp. A1]
MWYQHPFFKYMTGLILFLIAIFFLDLLHFFSPIQTIISTLFFPILIAGFLYYILNPVVRWISKIKYIPVSVSILLVYTAIAGVIYSAYILLANTIEKQVSGLSNDLPEELKKKAKETEQMIEENDRGMLGDVRQRVTSFFSDLAQTAGDNAAEIFSTITGAVTVLIVVPFVLFYFLKDDHRLIPFLLRFIPGNHQQEGKKLLKNIDQTLGAYIIGQLTVAVTDGVLMYIGYLIIGLDYALVLGIFVAITAVVPFFGPIIGVLPAIVVSLTQEPTMVVYVLILLVIVQQLEGNIVAPVVLGDRLDLHPLTIILLLIVAAALYGFIGMLIAIPLYAVIKVTISNLYQFFRLRKIRE